MNNNDDHVAKETIYGLSIPSSLSAEEVLFGFVNELRHLVASLEGYTNIISEVGADPNYVSGLLNNIEQLRNLSDSARAYLMETNFLSKEKEVMHFLRENVFDPIVNSPVASSRLKELIVKTVRSLNAEAGWQMVDSWLYMTSKPVEFEVIHKMKEEGFTQFETTLAEFRTRFAQK
jgi:hypothetical protein